MNIFLRATAASILLMSQFFGLMINGVYAQETSSEAVAQEESTVQESAVQEQQLEKVEKVEKIVDKIYDIVEDRVKDEEMKDRLDEKKEEIDELLEEATQDIKEGTTQEEAKEILQDAKEKIYLKTYSGLTDHDSVDELVQVEGGPLKQEQAIDTAVDSMLSEENSEFTVMLQSRKSFEDVKKSLSRFDGEVLLELLFVEDGIGYFELLLEEDSLLGKELLSEIAEGEIPDHLLGISVVKPEVYEIGAITVAGHKGEQTTKLRGMQQYNAIAYQGGLQQKKKITVGVVDTGIDRNHPDLRESMSTRIPGYDFVNKDSDPMDDHVHGTHVAGTIGGALNGQGVYGVNSHVEFVALKICNKYGYCPSYAIHKAVKYAADKGIDVLNMSLGGRGSTRNNTTCQAIDYAVKKGVIVLAAAGNANRPVSQYIPGACPQAITVGAVDKNHKRAGFSNYGPLVDVSAPGVGIYSSVPGNKYESHNGTSMATPHISGLTSAILAYKPNLTQSQIRALLKKYTSKVTYEPGKVIGGFVEMPKVMAGLGVKQFSHAYKPSNPSVGVNNDIQIQSYDDTGMKVSTQHIKVTVGQKKQVVVSDAYKKIAVTAGNSNRVAALGIGNIKDSHRKVVRIQSADGKETEKTDIVLAETGEELDVLPTEKELEEAFATTDDLEEGIEIESLSDEEDSQEIEQQGAMIASANKVGIIDVLGLKPGITSITITDGKLKKIQVKVEVVPKTISVLQGKQKAIGLPSWARARGRGRTRLPFKHQAYQLDRSRSGAYFIVTGKQLGNYSMTLPIYNFHGPKRNGSRKAGSTYLRMEVGLKVVSPRVDAQSKKQANDQSFQMSHDYAKLKVGEKVTINIQGQGPFKILRKTGGIVGYAGKTGSGTKIASAGDDEGESEEAFDLDVPKIGLIEEDEANELMSQLLEKPLDEEDEEEREYEGEEEPVALPEFSEQEANTPVQDSSEGVEIASASNGTTVTLVGLMPGNEVLYVTDKKGRTKNIIVQVQETRLTVSECKRNYRGYYDRNCGKLTIYSDPSRNHIKSMSFASYKDYQSYYGRTNRARGYEIPGYRNNRSYAYKYFNKISLQRGRRSASTAPVVMNVYVENNIEDPVYSRRSRRGKKVLQTMQYTIDFGKAKTAKAVTPLAKLTNDITEVPDAFKLAGTMKLTVGDMKTVMVGSQGGRYSYWKHNNNIGFISNKTQDVKIASASDTNDESEDSLVEAPEGEEVVEGEEPEQIVLPENVTPEPVTEEQLVEIEAIEAQEGESDLEYKESSSDDEEVAIASVKGTPVTFVALRPGVSYITVKYSTGKWERVKVIISPKVVKKKSHETLRLVSTHNLVIKNIRTKKRASLKFVKKPRYRWRGGTWEIQAGSMNTNDKLYALMYNRKERRYNFLELDPQVTFPPIKTSRNSVNLVAGQHYSLKILGGGGVYSVSKNTDRLGFIHTPNNSVRIASAGEAEQDDQTQFHSEIELEETEEIEIDEELEIMPTPEQLAEPEPEAIESQESDLTTADAVAEEDGESEGVEIASAWKKTIYFQGLRPVSGRITIKDNKGLSKVVPVSVSKKTIRKDDGELLKLTSVYNLPIQYLKTKSGTPIKLTKRPRYRWRGGARHVDTSNFKSTETIYTRVYNRKERRYQRLEFDVVIKPAPPITTNKNSLVLRVGQMYNLQMAGGARKITVKKGNHKIGLIPSKSQGVAIASAGAEEKDEEAVLYTDVDEADEPELQALVDEEEALPTAQQLAEEASEEAIEAEMEAQDRGEVSTEDAGAEEFSTEDEGIAIASAKKRRQTIPIQALRPGKSSIIITDEKGQKKTVNVTVYATTKTKTRGDILTFRSAYHQPILKIVSKSGQALPILKKPATRWRGGTRQIDTSKVNSDTVYARILNRKEKKYLRVEIKLVVKDIPFNVSLASSTGIVGAEKAFTIKGGLPPYSFVYDKKKVEILKVKPGSTKPDGNYYIFPLVAGKTSITVKDAHTQSKKLDLTVQALDTTVVPGEELRFSNKPGFYLSQISATNGTNLPIRKTPNTRFVDTSNITQNTDLTIYKYSDVERKSLKYTYNIITREVATGPSGYTLCAKDNGKCIAKDNVQVAYGTKGKYRFKDLAKGQSLSCSIATFGNPVNGVRACRTKVIKLSDLKGPAGYTQCAMHGGTCTVPSKAKVAYGVDGKYDYKTTAKAVACNTSEFKDVAKGKLKGCWYEVIVEKVVEEEPLEEIKPTPVPQQQITPSDTIEAVHLSGLGFSFVSIETSGVPKEVGVEYKKGGTQKITVDGTSYIDIVESNKGAFRGYYIDQNNTKHVGEYNEYSEVGIASAGVEIAGTPERCTYNKKSYIKPYYGECTNGSNNKPWKCNSGSDLNSVSCIHDIADTSLLVGRWNFDLKMKKLLSKFSIESLISARNALNWNSEYKEYRDTVNYIIDFYLNGVGPSLNNIGLEIENFEYTSTVYQGYVGGVYYEVAGEYDSTGIEFKENENGSIKTMIFANSDDNSYGGMINPINCGSGCNGYMVRSFAKKGSNVVYDNGGAWSWVGIQKEDGTVVQSIDYSLVASDSDGIEIASVFTPRVTPFITPLGAVIARVAVAVGAGLLLDRGVSYVSDEVLNCSENYNTQDRLLDLTCIGVNEGLVLVDLFMGGKALTTHGFKKRVVTKLSSKEGVEQVSKNIGSDSSKVLKQAVRGGSLNISIPIGGSVGAKIYKYTPNEIISKSNVSEALTRIKLGKNKFQGHDGVEYKNSTGLLDKKDSGYYKEYTVETPGVVGRSGSERIVIGKSGDTYYTDQHYESFIRLK